MRDARKNLFLALPALTLACTMTPSWSSGNPGQAATATGSKVAAAAAKPGAAVTAPAKGNGSGVVLQYTVPDKIAVGQTVNVRLQFSGIAADDGATVEVREAGSSRTLLSTQLQRGEQRTVDISVTPSADGMQYLDVTTQQAGRTTVQSVPLRVGTGKVTLKESGKAMVTPSGERVISMPANK